MDISKLKENLVINSKLLPKSLASTCKKYLHEWAHLILENSAYSKVGLPIYTEKDKTIHSKIDPHVEAKRLLDIDALKINNRWIVLPADLLYSLEYALNSSIKPPNLMVFLYYEDITHFLTCWSLREYNFLRSVPFIIHIPKICEISSFDWQFSNLKGTYWIHNTAYQRSKKDFIDFCKKMYYQEISDWYSSHLTQFYFEKQWIINTLCNLAQSAKLDHSRNTVKLSGLKPLKNKRQGRRCYIVGAGPSLYQSLTEGELEIEGDILCLDTALMPLLACDLEPDFVVTLDSGYANSLDFERLPSEKCSLIGDVSTHPSIFKRFKGNKYLFVSSGEKPTESKTVFSLKEKVLEYFIDDKDKVPVVYTPGSVVHAAYQLALYLGYREIVFHGIDFSSPFFDSHIYSSSHFAYFYQQSNRLHPVCSQDCNLLFARLKDKKEKSSSGFFFYREQGLYEYGRALEQLLVPYVTHFSSSMWGMNIKNVSTFADFARSKLVDSKLIDKNEIYEQDFLIVQKEKYAIFSSIKTLLVKTLESLEKKEIAEFQKKKLQLDNYLKQVPFITDAMGQLKFHLKRRSGEDPYLIEHHFYGELFKLVYIIEQKIPIFAEKT